MKRTVGAILILFLGVNFQALAQGGPGGGCFRANEMRAEANVRMSFMLRERAKICAGGTGSKAFTGLPKQWSEFEQANTAKIKQAVDLRKKAIERNFKSVENSEAAQNERLIATFRDQPAYEASCKQIADILGKLGKEAWGGLEKRGRDFDSAVKRDWPAC